MSKSKEIEKGKVIEGNIVKEMDRRFLSSLDLAGHGDVELTIDRVEKVEKLQYLNGQSQDNAILLYFKETKRPLTLNATNIKRLIQITETNVAKEWTGIKIKLAAVPVSAFGKNQLAVRIQ